MDIDAFLSVIRSVVHKENISFNRFYARPIRTKFLFFPHDRKLYRMTR